MALRLGELVGNLHGVLTVGAVENRHPLGVLTPAFPFFPINIGVLPLLVIMLLAVLGVFKLSPVRASQELRFSNPKASTCEDTPGRAPLPFYLEVPYQVKVSQRSQPPAAVKSTHHQARKGSQSQGRSQITTVLDDVHSRHCR